ncbi:MAG: RsmB/NOP family class I SAM-dependent RNA methyltransferase [Rhodobacter sp.]|jgi:16S rRNA (cytosine967-C5)-methyltransferase|nr:RsmB/NOP family class I SAM-dependent RNA methyltransferase [Rhodobacter sp.]
MTPAARLSAAIAVLDLVLAGLPAGQALTNWGRASRFAGSGDRAAVRDTVFEALRCRRSFAALGGGETGRGLVLGGLRAAGVDPATLFTGLGHAPAPLTDGEAQNPAPLEELVALDCPDWLAPALKRSLGADFAPVMRLLRHRAPVFLRVNRARLTRDEAQARLAAEGIVTQPHGLAPDALEVTGNARKISGSAAYRDGSVELQDVASQAVAEALPLAEGARVLDFCAGGGGKTLAMGARLPLRLFAHDAEPGRMRDLPQRADRAGISVQLLDGAAVARAAPFDLVLADAPCSGSGSWRRDPEGKWRLTEARLAQACALQAQILDHCADLVAAGGRLAYATCSLLEAENRTQITQFLGRHPGWNAESRLCLTPLQGGDGFYLAVLARG